MDLEQATQMLTWLDEQRRSDKAELIKLQQRVESQAAEIVNQAKRIEDLEGRLAKAQAQPTKFSQFDQRLQQFKDDVALVLKKHDEQRQKAEAEAARLRRVERGSQAKTLTRMSKELQKLPLYEEELQTRWAEERRLNEALVNLQQKVADLTREGEKRANDLVYLKEQRRQDAKRVSELRGETAKLLELSEAQAAKLELLEEENLRHKQKLDKLLELRKEQHQEQKQLMETMQLNELRRQKQMEAWSEGVEEWQQQVEEQKRHFQRLKELYRENQRVLEGLEKFEEHLKQEQAKVAELQRLAEERMKGNMEEWREDNEKRWKKQLTLWEHKWSEQKRHNQELRAWLERLEERCRTNRSQIFALWQARQESARHQMAELEQQLVEMEEYASGS